MKKFVLRHVVAGALAVAASSALAHPVGEPGAVSEGHVGSATNMPVTGAFGDCWNFGTRSGAGEHPKDCAIQPPPPPTHPSPPPQ